MLPPCHTQNTKVVSKARQTSGVEDVSDEVMESKKKSDSVAQ